MLSIVMETVRAEENLAEKDKSLQPINVKDVCWVKARDRIAYHHHADGVEVHVITQQP